MKTATITFHAPNNNGSFFQAYALQKVLTERLGVDNEIIDFRSDRQIRQYSVFRRVSSARDLAKNAVSLLHYRSLKLRDRRFEELREGLLKMTKRCATAEDALKIAAGYEAVLVGSDQVWNTGAPDFSRAYLLPDVSVRKIAYAVSLGSFSGEAELVRYQKEIESFYRISLREESARQHLKRQICREADLAVDPVLLLDGEDYLPLASPQPLIEGDYIFFYSVSYPDEALRTARRIGKQMGLPVVTAFTSFHTIACERHGIQVRYDAGPREFLRLLLDAKLVLTNSFHGTAFSLVLHKPFFYLCKTLEGDLQRDDRIDGLIEALGLQGCKVGIDWPVERVPVLPWRELDMRRHEMRDRSLDYLREALA